MAVTVTHARTWPTHQANHSKGCVLGVTWQISHNYDTSSQDMGFSILRQVRMSGHGCPAAIHLPSAQSTPASSLLGLRLSTLAPGSRECPWGIVFCVAVLPRALVFLGSATPRKSMNHPISILWDLVMVSCRPCPQSAVLTRPQEVGSKVGYALPMVLQKVRESLPI